MTDLRTDAELLRLVHVSDMNAFRNLYRRYERRLWLFVLGMLGREDAAKSVMCEIFVRVYDMAGVLAGEADPRVGLFVVARELTQRRAAQSGSAAPPVRNLVAARPPHSILETDPDNAAAERLSASLQALDPSLRELLFLFEFEELNDSEVAAVTHRDEAELRAGHDAALEQLRRVWADASAPSDLRRFEGAPAPATLAESVMETIHELNDERDGSDGAPSGLLLFLGSMLVTALIGLAAWFFFGWHQPD